MTASKSIANRMWPTDRRLDTPGLDGFRTIVFIQINFTRFCVCKPLFGNNNNVVVTRSQQQKRVSFVFLSTDIILVAVTGKVDIDLSAVHIGNRFPRVP